MREYKTVVLGDPVAQGRPRFSWQGGFVKAYDPTKSRDYKQYIRLVASEDAPEAPVTGAVLLSVRIYRAIPKSMPRYKREAALAGKLRPTTRPDVSNVLKGVEDALKGLWYVDDSQIVGYGAVGKWYDKQPRIEITMWEIPKWEKKE
jgi:Holliday junction resolvase RusA-like endonuclease